MAEGYYWVTVIGRKMAAMLWADDHEAAARNFARQFKPSSATVEVDQGGMRHGKRTFKINGAAVSEVLTKRK